MHKPFEIIQVGLGPMGKIITSLLLKRQNILLILCGSVSSYMVKRVINSKAL